MKKIVMLLITFLFVLNVQASDEDLILHYKGGRALFIDGELKKFPDSIFHWMISDEYILQNPDTFRYKAPVKLTLIWKKYNNVKIFEYQKDWMTLFDDEDKTMISGHMLTWITIIIVSSIVIHLLKVSESPLKIISAFVFIILISMPGVLDAIFQQFTRYSHPPFFKSSILSSLAVLIIIAACKMLIQAIFEKKVAKKQNSVS